MNAEGLNMDSAQHWTSFLSRNSDLQGGALMSLDGELISKMSFVGSVIPDCVAMVTLVRQLTEDAHLGEFDVLVLRGEQGYVVLMSVLDKAILAVLAHKNSKLGLVILDMRRAIDGSFGPGLAIEPVFPPQPPQQGTAHARPS
jgi:predicted regulator of Ras-like GTPase activity (Roadblock/LC7/MglB family)